MARCKTGIMFLIVFAGLACIAFADFTGKVVAVKDGDTIEVLRNGTNAIRVCLSGIDCPEKKQAFGQRAKQFSSELAFGKQVKVIEKGRDRYGRTLGEIILANGRSLNQELVRAGLAWWYKQYAPKDTKLEALEKEARKAKRGLWIDIDTAAPPIQPWTYRKKGRKAIK